MEELKGRKDEDNNEDFYQSNEANNSKKKFP
jgi:hypothetical protein